MILNLFNCVLLISYHLFCVFLIIYVVIVTALILLCPRTISVEFGSRSRRCGKLGCSGYKNSAGYKYMEQTEECLKLGGKHVEEVDNLPVKQASEHDDFDIESLMDELKELAPVNGRALYLFTDKCGCRVAKLEAWGTKERYISKEDDLCCICLAKYSNKAELRQLPCSHFYHKECIDGVNSSVYDDKSS